MAALWNRGRVAALMDIAIVAPCPIPYTIGGAENLWRGLQDHINEHTPHQAEVIKLPSPEHSFWALVDSYRRFAALDLRGFDLVVTGKYPAWMIEHRTHVCYMLHRLRGLYDTYHFLGMPDRYPDAPAPVVELREFMASSEGRREELDEFFARLGRLRNATHLPSDLFAFPGPFAREVVHFLDGIGLAPSAIARFGAISATVRDREGYFPPERDVFVAHPPTALKGAQGRRAGSYLFTASRLDGPKRIDLLVRAMEHAPAAARLRIAGTGPDEQALRELAAGNPRIELLGRVTAEQLGSLYAGARAIVFVPYLEDFGYITLEGMRAGRPVITCTDSGGARELVTDGVTGLVAEPTPEALGDAIGQLWNERRLARRLGRAARKRASKVAWEVVVRELVSAE